MLYFLATKSVDHDTAISNPVIWLATTQDAFRAVSPPVINTRASKVGKDTESGAPGSRVVIKDRTTSRTVRKTNGTSCETVPVELDMADRLS